MLIEGANQIRLL